MRGFLAERLEARGQRRGTRTLIEASAPPGTLVAELLAGPASADARYALLFDAPAGRLPEHVEVVLNDRVLDLQGGLAARLQPGDVLTLLPAHAGGTESG